MRALSIVFAAAAAVVVAAAPASAAPSGTTDATFSVDGGTLDITVPASIDLGTTYATGQASAFMEISVVDERAALVGTWTADVVGSDFVTGAGTQEETIPASLVQYRTFAPPDTTGTGTVTFLYGQYTIDTPTVFVTKTDGAGNNSATWYPMVSVDAPAAGVAGTYTGTITHSVA